MLSTHFRTYSIPVDFKTTSTYSIGISKYSKAKELVNRYKTLIHGQRVIMQEGGTTVIRSGVIGPRADTNYRPSKTVEAPLTYTLQASSQWRGQRGHSTRRHSLTRNASDQIASECAGWNGVPRAAGSKASYGSSWVGTCHARSTPRRSPEYTVNSPPPSAGDAAPMHTDNTGLS